MDISAPSPVARGFTLLELLVVVAIVAVLAAVSGPALRRLGSVGGVVQAANQAASLLELARDEAVTRQTYVWVGFRNATDRSDHDGAVLIVAAALSQDGSGNNTAPSNLRLLGKPVRIRNAMLVPFASLQRATRALAGTTVPFSVAANTEGIATFLVDAVPFTRTLTFTPRGEIVLKGSVAPDDGYEPSVDVSFCEARGAGPVSTREDTAILLDGATGAFRIVRQ